MRSCSSVYPCTQEHVGGRGGRQGWSKMEPQDLSGLAVASQRYDEPCKQQARGGRPRPKCKEAGRPAGWLGSPHQRRQRAHPAQQRLGPQPRYRPVRVVDEEGQGAGDALPPLARHHAGVHAIPKAAMHLRAWAHE